MLLSLTHLQPNVSSNSLNVLGVWVGGSTEESSQRLGCFEEFRRRHGIVLRGVDWDVGEGFLERVEEGSSWRVCVCGRHCFGG